MFVADRDYEGGYLEMEIEYPPNSKPDVRIESCVEIKGYSVVGVSCKDRPKLMFDIYFIRHMDGCILESEAEKERVVKFIEATIWRRISDGFILELCAKDRVGLLSEVTRVLRENRLSVTRAGVTTIGRGESKECLLHKRCIWKTCRDEDD
ncbi:ACT domain-containing protein ACR3 [Capsicum annuum]|uniref:ACT domain-containing protein ACR n=1 Tax=Capsicum annuum TaxID=4072 RepID=A0A2G3AJC3_CAPAN|nr:ACT domain-containing protein ACR3 [Capsicum annuum]